MSLTQHGSHTDRNKNANIAAYSNGCTFPPAAMIMWNKDAHVLKRTCPAWGILVFGQKYATITPATANGKISHHSSINPICTSACSIPKSFSPQKGMIESLNVAIPIDPIKPTPSKDAIPHLELSSLHL